MVQLLTAIDAQIYYLVAHANQRGWTESDYWQYRALTETGTYGDSNPSGSWGCELKKPVEDVNDV